MLDAATVSTAEVGPLVEAPPADAGETMQASLSSLPAATDTTMPASAACFVMRFMYGDGELPVVPREATMTPRARGSARRSCSSGGGGRGHVHVHVHVG